MCIEHLSISLIPRCSCGEPLDHEAEQDAGQCFCCQADEAGFSMPEPQSETHLTPEQIDQLCGVTHRRKAS